MRLFRIAMAGILVLPAAIANAGPLDGCSAARRVPGIDVSSYQGAIDWARVRAAGGELGAYHLSIAHYEVDCPRLPDGWQAWRFWQHSSSGSVPGVGGPVDLDQFAGTRAELRRLNRPVHRAVLVQRGP